MNSENTKTTEDVKQSTDFLENEIIDTAKPTFKEKLGAVFGSGSNYSGFAKLILLLALVMSGTVWYFSNDEVDKKANANTSGAGLSQRGKKEDVVPASVAEGEIELDANSASGEREEGNSFIGARPNTGQTTISDLLDRMNGSKAKNPPKEDNVIVDDTPVSTPKFNKARTAVNNKKPKNKKKQQSTDPVASYVLDKLEKNKNANEGSNFVSGDLVIYAEPETENQVEEGSEVGGETSDVATASDQAPVSNGILAHRAGYFLYGYTVTAVDTDVAIKEVVGEIAGGPLSGARIIGTWTRLGNFYEDLSLTFTKLEFQEKIYEVNLIAFNTKTSLPAFVSEVDRHILYRWGGLVAGATLDAAKSLALASAAISNPKATEALATVSDSLSGSDLERVFLSSAGSKIAGNLTDQFERPITSRVWKGQDMRLLSIEPIYLK